MVAPRRRVLALAAVIVASLCIGATVAVAQQDDAPAAATGDDALLERLDELEATLPTDPAPTTVTIDDEETWGSFEGDVTGAAAILGTVEPDLLSLYVDADDADGVVAEAVAEVARGWLDLKQGLDQLAVWEAADLTFPIDASDDDDVATDADELRGRAEAGLRLVLDARQRHLVGYTALRAAGVADAEPQSRFDSRAAQAEVFDQDVRPLVHRFLSLRTTQVIVPVDRFETSAPGVNARARSMTLTCVDRDTYLEAGPDGATTTDPELADPDLPPTITAPRADCPDLPVEQDVAGG
ncbi:MAG: hypothetical protein WEB03_14060 [Nitriliruptor sp.]|uniref:hypothetical protein n=1 Tax=Nitriliruptor sp. TaxID=2448056 RepID=UPI0034A01CCD